MAVVTGSIRKLTLDGLPFNVAPDTNISEIGSAYENSAVAGSSFNIKKMMKRSETRENVVLLTDSEEREALRELADRTEDFPISYETAEGSTFRTDGWIDFENRETEESRSTIKLFPRTRWRLF